jgi:hypothetical protein
MTPEELKRRGWNEKAGSWWYGEWREPHQEWSEALPEAVERIVDERLRELLAWVYGMEHNGHIRPVVENTLKSFYASRKKKNDD